MPSNIPIISFVGYSGSGKTTLIEKLIPELKSRNIRLAVVKHDAHDFSIDKEGKDTWRFSKAGADVVTISSASKVALIKQTEKELKLEEVTAYIKNVDLIITEGYRAGNASKIGICRQDSGKGLSVAADELAAIVSDMEFNVQIPCYDLEDITGVADFIQNSYLKKDGLTRISLEQALTILLDLKVRTETEYVNLPNACNRILAQDVIASEMIPPFPKSPFDGYAFRAKDTFSASVEHPVTLEITEEIPAGKQPVYPITSGKAAKILTGAPIPEGADAVTKYEDTEFDDLTVKIYKKFSSGKNIIRAGEDIGLGDEISKQGLRITPPVAGLLASLGIASPLVYKKPVISIVNTGDELLYVNEPLSPAKIRNSNHYMLTCYLQNLGVGVLDGGTAKDNTGEIAKLIKTALSHSDMVITTGGVSVGDYDLVGEALDLLGANKLFWKINIKPGGAVIAATMGEKLVLGLSGNPASAVTTLHLLGIPYIHKLTGRKLSGYQKIKVHMRQPFNKESFKTRYLRGKLLVEGGKAYFDQIEIQGNGSVSSLKDCNLIGEIKAGSPYVNKDELIDAYLID